ncbi:MAG: indolepyruvate oxidoreductase subunit B [Bradyrhizobiaceae bacterium]|nr:MAG: indolepyruvate oxidoreductase subunit B [Bradyrhizobiaceae bacterium]
MSAPRPVTLLISALGGEGGGVLTSWIVAAAEGLGLPVQSTSIPGVAQRTGSTTYYIEIMPVTAAELGGRRPVLALTPGVGDIDLFAASELLEAGRGIAGGFVTRDRTFVVASTSRFYAMTEKTAMGDGRTDSTRLVRAIEAHAQGRLLFDMEEAARASGAMINAVMLGAIAGSGRLPIPTAVFEQAIRAEGKAAEANLAGFRAGLDAARREIAPPAQRDGKRRHGPMPQLAGLEAEAARTLPAAAHEIAVEGLRRLAAYQDTRYARLYLDRLAPIREADAQAGAAGKLVAETARHLAVRMSFEDVIRVAQEKIDPARIARIRADNKLGPDDPIRIVEFLKPGIEEICSVLPPRLARAIIGYSARKGWLGRVYFGMEIDTLSVTGWLRFRALAALRRVRPKSHRYAEEQAQIETWLAAIRDAAKLSRELAREIAECARLIKGYGDTHARGWGNYAIIEQRLIRPALAGTLPAAAAVDAIASARTAALLDPEGEALANCLAEIARATPLAMAAE